jgi:replicative DNA helicase
MSDYEAERAVLGSIFIDEMTHEKIFSVIKHDYFQDPKHEIIFRVLHGLYLKGITIDSLVVSSELKKTGRLKDIGGNKYITELIASVPSVSNISYYVDIVADIGKRSALKKVSSLIINDVDNLQISTDEIIDNLEKKLLSIVKSFESDSLFDAQTLIEMQLKLADEFAKNPDGLRGMSTGLSGLDNVLGGLHKSDLIIVAARPGVGKSAFTFDIARYIAVNLLKSVLIFSLEMPAVQVISRILAQQTEINLWNIRMGKLSKSEYPKFTEGMGKISNSKIYVDDTASISLQLLRSKARKLKMERGLDLIVVDYLQLMQTSGKGDNRAFEIGEISRSLKILARELNIPIIALSQLNRAVENRQEKIPQLSDLRESGSIEQDADLVIFLGRDIAAEIDEQQSAAQTIDVFIAKHRNGPVGRLRLKFDGSKQKFYDIMI